LFKVTKEIRPSFQEVEQPDNIGSLFEHVVEVLDEFDDDSTSNHSIDIIVVH